MTENKNFLSKFKNLHLSAIGIGWYRVITSLDAFIDGKQPEIVGPFLTRMSATQLPERMGARIYFPSTKIEFHILKPQGTKKPDPSEFEKIR